MKKQKNQKEVSGFLKGVEVIGNRLPHPAMIFFILCVVVVIASHFVSLYGEPITYFDAKAGEQVTKSAKSLLNGEGLSYIFNSAVTNFTSFAPLGTVLVAMLGVGVCEWTGLFNTGLRKALLNANSKLLTPIVVFAGIMSNVASDAGYIVVVPLGAIIFGLAGRHPLAGLAAAFAGVSGGFSANLILGTTDPLLTNITNEALNAAQINMSIPVTSNMYFLQVSTIFLTIVGTFVTDKIVEPNLGGYKFEATEEEASDVSSLESKGIRNAMVALAIYVVVMAFLMVPDTSPFRALDEATGKMTLNDFLHNGLILGMMLIFLIPGLVYGATVGKIKNSHDLVAAMTSAMKSMGGYLVLAFFASQFIAYFGETNLGAIISYKGAEFLKNAGIGGFPLIVIFILFTGFINLFMGSASAKWAIMAPIFVPMLLELGFTPALTQVAYRIGDSSTNIISPLMSYFAMIVVFMQKYDEESGLGTLISMMLPYSIAFLIFWTALMGVFFLFNLPIGLGGTIFM
ncbi:AbgT family transporter [Peptoniphilus equinus]|uniref:AbgT family transporter n=1 Tax=Peptoniphilus equinus TaxID=3016343 RepID=A0ABY7QSV2_9FIRM|nr:AbgT family transporter [Peptoniphilus equinus]WBW49881.1 AbgT family transporter [Peptoniphilus equinus]